MCNVLSFGFVMISIYDDKQLVVKLGSSQNCKMSLGFATLFHHHDKQTISNNIGLFQNCRRSLSLTISNHDDNRTVSETIALCQNCRSPQVS